jgi:hypothetical protein
MAESLGVVPEGEVIADTASARGIRFRTGRVQSIAVEGVEARNVRVAIGSPELDMGLLGQDFYENYSSPFGIALLELCTCLALPCCGES